MKCGNHIHLKKKKGKEETPKATTYISDSDEQVCSPAHETIRVCSEDSNSFPPLITYVRTTSHVAPRPRKADVARTRGESQADE